MKRLVDLEEVIKDEYRAMACVLPLDKITVAELCRRVGVSRKAFYTRFESRETVLDCILLDDLVAPLKVMFPALIRTVDEDVSARILNEQIYQDVAAHAEFYQRLVTLNEESVVDYVFQRCLRVAQDYSHEVLGGRRTEEYEYASHFLAAAQSAMLIRWLRTGMKTSSSQLAEWFNVWSSNVIRSVAKG